MDSDPQFAAARLETWQTYVSSLDWGPGCRDRSGFNAFLRAGSLKIDPDFAIEEVVRVITAAGGTFTTNKIQSQQRRAYEIANNKVPGQKAIVRPPRQFFAPEKLQKLASKVAGVDRDWLIRNSPVVPDGLQSREFLELLYTSGEKVLVFTTFESQGQVLYEIDGKWQPPLPAAGPNGVWYLVNPVDGLSHPNPRQDNRPSRRSEEAVTSWRYLVLESDKAPEDQWIAALVQLPLKISAIYTSGGKSIHALVRIDAADKHEWDRKRDAIRVAVVPLGADEGALTGVRLSRLPGAFRGDQLQRLLYLDPSPLASPIVERKGELNE